MQVLAGKPIRCGVCGFDQVRVDEVFEQGFLVLAACPRCDHRFTMRTAPAPRGLARARSQGEGRAAA